MKQEEKWPVFQTSPRASRKFPVDSTNNHPGGRQSGEFFEEMSGMVTLKRKKGGAGDDQSRTITDESALQNLF